MDDIYLEFTFIIAPLQPARDILMAELAELAFDSFVETEKGLQAYVTKKGWDDALLKQLQILDHPDYSISYTRKEIPQQNWNAEWEQNFKPIQIDNRCMVRAHFHEPDKRIKYDIVITPKMSFGTGHHETTHMMLAMLLEQEVMGKYVLDMGCGTGVLAILAALRGASAIDAIDLDHWSCLNAIENSRVNHQDHIRVLEGDATLLNNQEYDLILANINRNILLEDLPAYACHLHVGGRIILSGFYTEDLAQISDKCAAQHLKFLGKRTKNNWVAAVYRKS